MNNLKNIWNHLGKGYRYFLMMWIIGFGIGFILIGAIEHRANTLHLSGNLSFSNYIEKNQKIEIESKIAFDIPIFRHLNGISKIKMVEIDSALQSEIEQGYFRDMAYNVRYMIPIASKGEYKPGEILANLVYQMDFSDAYKLLLLHFAIGVLIVFYIAFAMYSKSIEIDSKNDKIFLLGILAISLFLFIFTFYLGYPGYNTLDSYSIMALNKSNASPVIIPSILEIAYKIFGIHSYYLFLANVLPFYLGLFMLVSGLYLRFRKLWVLGLFGITLIANIYFQNFAKHSSFSLPMILFLFYSMIMFLLLVPKFRFKIVFICCMLLIGCVAILWRHNAIFSVYPAFFVFCYLILSRFNFKGFGFVWRYLVLLLLSAIICVGIVLGVPKILSKGESTPANHLFLHQIAGACVPSNDAACFKDEWYKEGNNFQDTIELYYASPLLADTFIFNPNPLAKTIFKRGKLDGLTSKWIISIIKHPLNYTKHVSRFFMGFWLNNPGYILSSDILQERETSLYGKDYGEVRNMFKESERFISLDSTRLAIYETLYKYLPRINHIFIVLTSLFVMIVSGIYIFTRKINSLLIFSFACGFAGFFTAFFVAIFSPVPDPRYMSPVLPLAILSLVGFVAYMLDRFRHKIDSPS